MNVAVVIPCYKPVLDRLESYSLDRSLAVLKDRDIYAVGPEGLDISTLLIPYPRVRWKAFAPFYFESIQNYNRLLLSTSFYEAFGDYSHILILQTDALILRDDLDAWCARPFDYIGAPWPEGWEGCVKLGKFGGELAKTLRVYVGNGGLSLRRIDKVIRLLQEFQGETLEFFLSTGSSEDLFFSFMGALSEDFIIPNEITASLFSLELRPSYYYAINKKLPMGTHAWWKYEPEFWYSHLANLPIGVSL